MLNCRILILYLFAFLFPGLLLSQSLQEQLSALPGISATEEIPPNPFFSEAHVILMEQAIDHQAPDKGSFQQRIIVSHKGFDLPTVVVTEGYNADYALRSSYQNELCPLLNANLVFIEHRFFGKSKPKSVDWQHLNIENAAADHHKVVETLKKIYTHKWVATGISKGGQTAMFYRMLYPEDVDATVAYVAPVNFALEEQRHPHFIEKEVATRRDRKKVYKFQKTVLKKRDEIMPYFKDLFEEEGFNYKVSLDEIYDLCVLEYSFAFWQWVGQPIRIPKSKAATDELFAHFTQVSDPGYFSVTPESRFFPFFVQASKELGYYAYNATPFKKWMSIENSDDYLDRVFLGPDLSFTYSNTFSKKLHGFLENDARRIMCIYGGLDPWTSSGVKVEDHQDFYTFIAPNGTHKTRISHLNAEQKAFIQKTLQSWLAK